MRLKMTLMQKQYWATVFGFVVAEAETSYQISVDPLQRRVYAFHR